MKRITLVVSGNVQRAGYRDKVVDISRSLGLSGYAGNLPDGRVKIIAEGDDDALEQLVTAVNIKNTLINVENVEYSYSETTGEFSGFFKLIKGGETDERLDVAADLLKQLIDVTNNGFSTINSTMTSGFNTLAQGQNRMLEKQDSMLEKQDVTIHILEKVSDDTSEMKSTLSRIEVDIRDTKYSLSSFIEDKYQKLEGEIFEIKATLAKMQDSG
ncbi:MAG: acylphosphatase [ANME-2 cluster archaeon]|nr:acylphosphatase [ANME-2 cluster archaeon]